MGDAVDVVRDLYSAWRRRHVEDLCGLFHPDAELRLFMTGGKPVRGEEAIRRLAERILSDTVYEFRETSVRALDVEWVIETGSIRFRSDAGGILHMTGAWLWRIRDGRVLSFVAFPTEAAALEEWFANRTA